MPTCFPTRMLAAPDPYPAHAALRSHSPQHAPRYPCGLPIDRASTIEQALAGHLRPLRCPPGIHAFYQATFNPHTSTALAA